MAYDIIANLRNVRCSIRTIIGTEVLEQLSELAGLVEEGFEEAVGAGFLLAGQQGSPSITHSQS